MADDLPKIPASLKNALKNGKVIPFVGSGISRAVQLNDGSGKPLFPSWWSYIEILEDALNNKGKIRAADYVRECLNSKPPDYLEAMQIAYNRLGETQWDELLDENFDFEKKDAVETSLELCRFIWHLGSNLIITTNIDNVLHWTCPKSGDFKLLDFQKKELGQLHKEINPKRPTVLYFHGHIDNKADIVFTKDAYKEFYDYKRKEAKLETLKTILTRETILFLGFSLDDPYFLQQLNYFHNLYEGGADSFFVVIHKNEKDNPNIPDFVDKVVFEDFGKPLLNLLREMSSIACKNTDVEILKTAGSNSAILAKADEQSSVIPQIKEEPQNSIEKPGEKNHPVNPPEDSPSAFTSFIGTVKKRFQNSRRIAVTILLFAAVGVLYWFFIKQPAIIELTDARKLLPVDPTVVTPLQNEAADTKYRNATENNEAYKIYGEGLQFLARRTKGDIQLAIIRFTAATHLDPNFALAYVGIADSYNIMASNAFLPPNESIPQAKEAAKRAIQINPDLAEAHAALANSLAVYDWDWEKSGREFNRAIELNPNIASVHYYYGLLYLTPLGRGKEAIAELETAVKLDPSNFPYKANLAGVYMYDGQYDKALEQAKRANEIAPNHWVGQIWLAQIYNAKGMYIEAKTISETLMKEDPTNQLYFRIPGYAYAKLNRRQEAEEMIKKLRDTGRKDNYVLSYRIASIYAALGGKDDKDRAFRELENSFTEHEWDLHRLKVDPFMASLRDDSRFQEMLKRLNLQK